MSSFSAWLRELGLERYDSVFAENDIDLETLGLLKESDLAGLGLSLGHRKKLLNAIAELKGAASSAFPSRSMPSPRESFKPNAERRQLSVLFCDLVGSTELSQRLDPEELRELMQVYQHACGEVIERYEGHIAQYLGDGLMVYFGWPHAHEDDAARAIRAALEAVDAVSQLGGTTPLRARVGIHTGLVVVGETGKGDASVPKAAVGDTPNIAARLQGLAGPGAVVVSARTRSLAGGVFDYAELGAHTLKGISEPVVLFQVTGTRTTESRFEAVRGEAALTPLVGREEELALLLRCWQQAKQGKGQVLLLGGEPGIGKSRLIRVLHEQIGGQSYSALRYQCSPYHVNSALYPGIMQLERAAGFSRDDTSEQKLDKMEAVLAGSAAQIAETSPLFAAMLSLPVERYAPLNLSPQKQKEKTLEALGAQVEALTQRQPVLMIYEDVHWIDATSQEALDLLVPRLETLAALLIVTYRPEYTPKWAQQAHLTTLGLSRLGRQDSAKLLASVTSGKALPSEVVEKIVTHTDGVPLFVEELTKSILESSLLRDAGDHYVLDGSLPALAIPTTLRDSLIARLDRLAPVREVAHIGACIGREFAYDLIAAVSPLKGANLDAALEQLTSSGLLFSHGTPPDATYTFKHALVQDAAYDSLLKSRRAQLHAQIAHILQGEFSDRVANEPELLAHHFTRAGLHQDAVPYWILAGQRALGRVALAESVAHLSTALTVNEQLPASTERDRTELDARLLLGTAYLMFLGWPAVQVPQTLEPARALALRLGEEGRLVLVLFHIWSHYATRCEFPQSLKVIDEVDAVARSNKDPNAYVIARNTDAVTQAWMGNFARARRAADLLVHAYDIDKHGHLVHALNHDPKCATLCHVGHSLYALGYPDQARQAALDQLELARRLGHAFHLCFALLGPLPLLMRGETGIALQWAAEALAVAQEHALTYVAGVMVPWVEGIALIVQGDYAEGYPKLAGSCGIWRSQGGLLNLGFNNAYMARALIGLERFDEARAQLDEALDLIDRSGHRRDEAEVHRVLGELLWRQPSSDPQSSENSFLKSLEVARSQEAKGFELRAAMSLAQLWRSQGKRRQACDLLAPIYQWFTEGFDTKDLSEAKKLLDELAIA